MRRRIMKISLLQMTCSSDKEKNVEKAISYAKKASEEGSQVLCLQELFSTIYFAYTQEPRYFELAESIPGPTTEKLQSAAREYGIAIIAPIFEVDSEVPGIYYNTAVVIDE
ncbi:MAG: nitrilase-related carbon-nitrogen hydrolase, partial [Conexivisphaerales archaeon]